jgi:Zn-dependent protease with chaperone function
MVYSAELYAHDLDRQAADALNQFPKFVKLLESYSANYDEKAAKIDLLSTAIRLSENQMPEIYGLLPPICEQLGIDTPEFYYVRDKRANAATFGSVHPCVYVTSGLVNKLPFHLLPSVLAHECGHIACKHSLYHSIAAQLVGGIDRSPLVRIPAIGKYLTPTLVRALLFWDRCSELSADRAAALCDGTADKTIDVLLRLNGYGKNVDRKEFLKQALDLKSFVNDSQSNKLMELMLVQDETHPRLATRAYECYEWSQSTQYAGIINGTFTLRDKTKETAQETAEEVVSADANVEAPSIDRLNTELARVNQELERYTNHADKADYALAVASGVLSGLVDSLFVGDFSLNYANQWGNQQAENLVLNVAKYQGYSGTEPAQAIKYLENKFPIAADKATAAFGGGLQHHLRDFSHHPTPVGLVCSILTQFTGNVYGTDVSGKFKAVQLAEDGLALVGKSIPEKITFGVVNWFFHMVSDVAGSSGSVMKGSFGTGLPGPLVSLLKEFSAAPLFKKQNAKGYKEFSVYISKLFNGTLLGERNANGDLIPLKFDLRTEMGVAAQIGQQTIPVIINECFVRVFYSLRRLLGELSREDIQSWGELDKINWNGIIPFRNRTVDRMLTIASMTFTVADTADAAVHAAIESGGNWVLFSGRFVARFNYVGAGRAALSIVRGVSNEKKEAQLIHEKMILSEAKAALFLKQLQAFKEQLDWKVSNYLAEDIEGFMAGFADMQQGLASGDSNLVIRGNVTIQKVLGREPQFANQKEFDELMESDIPLVL